MEASLGLTLRPHRLAGVLTSCVASVILAFGCSPSSNQGGLARVPDSSVYAITASGGRAGCLDLAKDAVGTLHMVWDSEDAPYAVWYQSSLDNGRSWSPAERVPASGCEARLVPLNSHLHLISGGKLLDLVRLERGWKVEREVLPDSESGAIWWDATSLGDTILVAACSLRRGRNTQTVDLFVSRVVEGQPIASSLLHTWNANENLGPGPRLYARGGMVGVVAGVMTDPDSQTIYGWTSRNGGRTWDALGTVSIAPGQFPGFGEAEPDLAIIEVKPKLKALLSFAGLVEITFSDGTDEASAVALDGYSVVERGGALRAALSVDSDSDLVAILVCAEQYWPSDSRRARTKHRANLLTVSRPGAMLDRALASLDPEVVSGTLYPGGIANVVMVGDTAIVVQRLSRDENSKGSEQYAVRVPIKR